MSIHSYACAAGLAVERPRRDVHIKISNGRHDFPAMHQILWWTAILLAALPLSACRRHLDESDIQQNPQPKRRYEITLIIEDAPGPFDSVTGKMGYDVINSDCVPQDPFTGARPTPAHNPPIVFTHSGQNVYKGIVYLDLLRDQNYFWLGVCHWKMTDAFMTLVANGVSFGADISFDKIVANGSTTDFIAKELYHVSSVPNLNVNSVPMSEYVAKNRDKFFSVTLIAKERQP